MKLRNLTRFVRTLLPNVHIMATHKLPLGIMGMAWLCDGEPVILYARGLSTRERDLTILHELAHHVLGDTRARVQARGRFACEQWREDRADRWAVHTLELLEP